MYLVGDRCELIILPIFLLPGPLKFFLILVGSNLICNTRKRDLGPPNGLKFYELLTGSSIWSLVAMRLASL